MDLSLHSLVFLFILSKWYFYKPIKKTLVWRQFLISGGEEMSLNHYVGEKISMNYHICLLFTKVHDFSSISLSIYMHIKDSLSSVD